MKAPASIMMIPARAKYLHGSFTICNMHESVERLARYISSPILTEYG
jgi:hypothetical protein